MRAPDQGAREYSRGHLASVYAVGFGPLSSVGATPVTLRSVRLLGASNLVLNRSLAADLKPKHAVFPIIAAGDVQARFPQTPWQGLAGVTLDGHTLPRFVFAVEVKPISLGEASFRALLVNYTAGSRDYTLRVPLKYTMKVIAPGIDLQAEKIESRAP